MTTEALDLTRTLIMAGGWISLLAGVLPMVTRGRVSVGWLASCVAAAMTLGVASMLLAIIAAGPRRDQVEAGARTTRDAGLHVPWWGIAQGMIIVGCFIAAWISTSITRNIIARRRTARAAEAKRRREALDPALIARRHAPDKAADVDQALERIARLRTLGARADVEALALVDARMSAITGMLADALAATDGDEAAGIAHAGLRGVIDLGVIAEEARARATRRMREDLEDEARYAARRSGADGLSADAIASDRA